MVWWWEELDWINVLVAPSLAPPSFRKSFLHACALQVGSEHNDEGGNGHHPGGGGDCHDGCGDILTQLSENIWFDRLTVVLGWFIWL